MIDPQAALTLDRLCFDVPSIAVYGSLGFIVGASPKRLGLSLAAQARRPIVAAAWLALLAALAWLPLEAATSTGSWSDAIDRELLATLLFNSSAGTAWMVRAGLAMLLTIILCRAPVGRAALLAAAVTLASLALTGHARMDSGWREAFHALNDVLHVLSGGAWLGALLMLPLCLTQMSDPIYAAEAGSALRRFSTRGHFAVGTVVVTGAINTFLTLPPWPAELNSKYWLLLGVKVCLAAAMIVLALVNRYVIVPRIRTRFHESIRRIRCGTYAELALGLCVLLVVAEVGLLDPL